MFIKPIFEYRDHALMLNQVLNILRNDGRVAAHGFFREHIQALSQGTIHVDLPLTRGFILWTHHFHHPWSHRGYLTLEGSGKVMQSLHSRSVSMWKRGQKAEAIYQLGRCVHLIQDAFVPQHAALTAFKGHSDFERWLGDNWERHVANDGGYYRWERVFSLPLCGIRHHLTGEKPSDFVDVGAHLSLPWIDALDPGVCPGYRGRYSEAASVLVAECLRYTAGFLARFHEMSLM